MSRGPVTFRQRDVTAAVKAIEAAGKTVFGVEITREGTIRVITHEPPRPGPEPADCLNLWLEKHARDT
jgi:hypothetical protein